MNGTTSKTWRPRGPAMIKILDSVRDLLEDLGGNLGVTDPVSGSVVAEVGDGDLGGA